MQRLTVALREGRRWEQARRLARGLNPVVVSPAAPREKVAALDAWGPSLMPRTARLQGVAMGLGVLGARATSGAAELLTRMVAPAEAPLRARLVARAVVGGAGAALAAVPERHCRHLWVASLRSTGLLLRDGAAGGAVHDVGHWLQRRYPNQRGIRPLAIGAVHTAGLLYRAGRRLPARGAAVDRRRLPETTSMATTLATSYVVTTVGTGLARGFMWSRGALESYFGPGPSKRALARLVNAGVWAGAAAAAYSAGVAYVGRANEKVEPGYATPPTSPLLSGSPDSLLPFTDLGQQGRRFVTDVVTPELIEEVMGEPAVPHRHRLGRPHPHRGRRVPHPRRHRHLLHPVRQVPVVPVGAEGCPGPRPVPAAAVGRHPAAGRPATGAAPAGAGVRREHGRLDQLRRRDVAGHPRLRPLRHRPGAVGGAAVAGQVVPQRHDPRLEHPGPGGDRQGIRPPRPVEGADRRPARPAAGGRPLPRQRPHRRAGPRPAGAAAPLAGRQPAGPRRPAHHALAAAGHLRPDGDGRDERDAVDAGPVRLLRPRLPRRHGPVRARRLRPARRHRRAARPDRGGPPLPGGRAGRAHQGRRRQGCPAGARAPVRTRPLRRRAAPRPAGPTGSVAQEDARPSLPRGLGA